MVTTHPGSSAQKCNCTVTYGDKNKAQHVLGSTSGLQGVKGGWYPEDTRVPWTSKTLHMCLLFSKLPKVLVPSLLVPKEGEDTGESVLLGTRVLLWGVRSVAGTRRHWNKIRSGQNASLGQTQVLWLLCRSLWSISNSPNLDCVPGPGLVSGLRGFPCQDKTGKPFWWG
jgi:hypothetical protein